MMNNDKYCMSFTTGGLFIRESVALARLYHKLGNWNAVRDKVAAKTKTRSTLKRVCHEVLARLQTLKTVELEVLIQASRKEQAYILWVAICRCYKFIADFAVEVLREGYIMLKSDLIREDFDSFFERKSEGHLELNEITPATQNKLWKVLFQILREANLLTANNMINSVRLSQNLLAVVHNGKRRDILFFPVFEGDL